MVKNFIDINNLSKYQIDKIITVAKKIKKNPKKFSTILKNKTLAMIFEKQSLRTRLSFSIGMQKLGGNAIELNSNDIGFDNNREDPKDIINVLNQYIDCVMIRNNSHKKLKEISNQNIIPIINGLTDYSHPCQILGDFLTIQENFKNFKDIQTAWIGDFNNVSRSLIHLQNIYKFKLNVVLPSQITKSNKLEIKNFKNSKLKFFSDPILGTKNTNCIMTDVWVSMGDKNKKKINYFKGFSVDNRIIKNASENVIFMHCLPAKRGLEVSSEVLDGKHSVVLQQARNRMFIQQAILIYVLK